jgi:hypothetical protein
MSPRVALTSVNMHLKLKSMAKAQARWPLEEEIVRKIAETRPQLRFRLDAN